MDHKIITYENLILEIVVLALTVVRILSYYKIHIGV